MQSNNRKKRVILISAAVVLVVGGVMFWNIVADKRVKLFDEQVPRDPETGIMIGAEPRTLGPENTDRAILFVHGFIGSPNNFNDLPDRVAAKGWYVRVMLLPGHGTTPREFETTNAAQLKQAVLDELAPLREKYKTLVLVGHSMGGALSTIAASEVKLEGLILAAPYYRITSPWYLMLPAETLINTFSPLVRWVYRTQDMLPVNRPEAKPEIVSYNWVPSAAGRMAIGLAAQARDPKVLEKITMPTLLLHSRIDTVTDPKESLLVFDQLPTTTKRAVWLKTSDHIIFWDYERERVAEEVGAFLEMVRRSDRSDVSDRSDGGE